jgi:1,4-alpha-glucan branching enzyme
MSPLSAEAYAVIEGRHSDPFRYLGPHVEGDTPLVRVFLPDAEGVAVIDEHGHASDLQRIHDAGLFEGRMSNGSPRYRLRARYGDQQVELEDPYRFPAILSDFDLYLLGEGTHKQLYQKLGAHPMILEGVAGVGNLRARGQGRRQVQVRDHRCRWQHAAVEIRSGGICRRAAAQDRFGCRR